MPRIAPPPALCCPPSPLQVHKVASYCLAKLNELNIHMEMRPHYLRRPTHAPSPPPLAAEGGGGGGGGADETGASGRPVLELLCNGQVRAEGAGLMRPGPRVGQCWSCCATARYVQRG